MLPKAPAAEGAGCEAGAPPDAGGAAPREGGEAQEGLLRLVRLVWHWLGTQNLELRILNSIPCFFRNVFLSIETKSSHFTLIPIPILFSSPFIPTNIRITNNSQF